MGRWTYQSDAAGNLITQTDALNNVLWFKYDELNRLVEKRQTGSNGPLLAGYTYGSVAPNIGYRLRLDDPSGYTTWAYDTRGRVTSESQTINGAGTYATGYGYDALDRVITTTYPTGEVITQTYTAQGSWENVRSLTHSQWYAPNLDYNADGSLALLAWGNNVTTKYGYFGLGGNAWDVRPGLGLTRYGRLWRSRTEKDGVPLADPRYSYDPVGNVTYQFDAPRAISGTLNYTLTDRFDTRNTAWWSYAASVTVPFNETGNNVVKSSGDNVSWNAQVTRTQPSLVIGGGAELRFKVDNAAAKFILALENNDGSCRRFGVYGHDGQLNVQYNDGSSCSAWREPTTLLPALQADGWYTLTLTLDEVHGQTLEVRSATDPAKRYTYNLGLTTNQPWRFHAWTWTDAAHGSLYLDDYREFNGGAVVTPDERLTFGYDAWDRLLSANKTTTDGYTQSYGYNALGNIISTTLLGAYTYNPSGATSVRPHAVLTAGSNRYSYDANGNMLTRVEVSGTQRITYTHSWDAENRLAVVTNTVSGQTAQYVYDGDPLRYAPRAIAVIASRKCRTARRRSTLARFTRRT